MSLICFTFSQLQFSTENGWSAILKACLNEETGFIFILSLFGIFFNQVFKEEGKFHTIPEIPALFHGKIKKKR